MVTLDETFEALRAPQRRRLLFAFLEANPRDDRPIGPESATALYEDDREALLQYHHVHLPKLEEYGLVEWDRDAGQVVKGPAFDEVRPLLELLRDQQETLPWELR